MRFYAIALFLACMYVVGGLLSVEMPGMGIQGIELSTTQSQADAAAATMEIENTKNRVQADTTASPTDILAGALGQFYQQVINAWNTLFDAAASPIIKYLVWLPVYLNWIGVPATWSWGMFGLVIIIEAVGVIEFISGREVER